MHSKSLRLRADQAGGRRLPWASGWLRNDRQSVLILCYHGVSKQDEHIWDPRLYIDADIFRTRMAALRDFGYNVLSLNDALERLGQDGLSGSSAVLTFDDGWHDFYSVAWPILQDFGFPATVYQTSYYSQYNRPVFDPTCRYFLWAGKGRLLRGLGLTGFCADLDLTTDDGISQAWQTLSFKVNEKGYSAEQKDLLLQRLAAAVEIDYADFLRSRTLHLMTASEASEVSQAGIGIELHTHTHRLPANRSQFHRELERNQAWIESATGRPAAHFCYPNGAYRPDLVAWLREAGVRSATTCEPGVARRGSAPLLLPRFTDASSITQAKFESWLTGTGRVAPFMRRLWRVATASADGPTREAGCPGQTPNTRPLPEVVGN